MTISSRTPEGFPHRCPLCGNVANIEPSLTTGDSCCPSCGQLLWWFRNRIGAESETTDLETLLTSSFSDLGADSLDTVELVMELEEEFDINIPEDAAEQIKTVADAIRYIQQRRRIEPA